MKQKLIKPLVLAMAMVVLQPATPATAGEREQLESLRATTQALIEALVAKGILSAEQAQDLQKQAEQKGQQAAAEAGKVEVAKAEAGVVRVPYIPEVVKRELREQLRQEVVAQAKTERWGEVNAVPEWLDRIKIDGDLRLRYQLDLLADDNASPYQFQAAGVDIADTQGSDQAGRLRARLGISAKVAEGVSAGLRLATGNSNSPVSTNQTLGATMNKNSLWLDRAYLKLDRWDWLSVSAGRIPNPFFSTDLVWDDDLNFEGLALTLRPWAKSTRDGKPFLVLGDFPLQHVNPSPTNLTKNRWLYGAQAGLDWRAGPDTRLRFGLAYYRYRNISALKNNGANHPDSNYVATVLAAKQKGNSLYAIDYDSSLNSIYGLASKYGLANLTASLDLSQFEPVHVMLTGDLVKNTGYKPAEMAARMGSGYAERTLGAQARLAVGMPSMRLRNDWQVFGGYRHLERDAVLDAFTDSDFHLGGTNTKGWFIGGMYGLERNTWMSLRWMSSDAIDGLPLSLDTLQVDLNAKF